MPFMPVRDLEMYYELRGSGPKLLYISGTGGDLRRSPTVFESPLADHFTILAYDQRGLGQTTIPDGPYTMADYAHDAAGLLDAVGWQDCLVMGVSFGGMVGQEFAIRYPQRVQRLVLACTSCGGSGGASFPLHTLADLSTEEYVRRFVELVDTRHDAAWQATHPAEFQAFVEMTASAREARAADPEALAGFQRQVAARAQHDVYDRLPGLSMPVYICGGRYDGIAPVQNLEAIRRQIPHARLELFEGGHGFLREDPAAFAAVIEFLLADE